MAAPRSGHATDATRARQIAAELNIPRRAWTICTVNDIGRAVDAGQATDATAMADQALADCADAEQSLRTKANELLDAAAAERLMGRLVTEARDALVGSARTLQAAKTSGGKIEPAWPRVLARVP